MRAGSLYYKVKFYAKVKTRDSYGASVDTWPDITISTRGELRNVGGNYSVSNEEKFYAKSKELTVRYRADIVETMRVQIDDTNERFSINYIETLGRNEGLRLTLEKIND
jgi:head-tail adaptor